MRAYMPPGRATEDPLDGPFPTKQTKHTSRKRRGTIKRRARTHKKGERQRGKVIAID